MAKATIDDVANLAGVSIKTVSRVVNHEPNVRESTREKVEKAINHLHYRPNISARNLASHKSHLIVLIYDDPQAYETPSSGYIIRLQQGALQACRATGNELLIHPCNYRNRSVRRELNELLERTRPDGVVIAAPLSNVPSIVAVFAESNIPYVRLSPGTQSRNEFAVSTNDQEISAEMTEHLASLGHERIAFITGHPRHKAVRNRFKGYRDGLKKAGLEYSEELVFAGDNSIASGEAATEALLALDDPPTAIFASNDDMAAGVIRVANKRGIEVPGQLSVAGFDDNSLARQVYPALTTVRQPLVKMAETAAEALIAHPDIPPESKIVPAVLKLRESTGPAPAGA
jgi:LacI family transcriptional regulator